MPTAPAAAGPGPPLPAVAVWTLTPGEALDRHGATSRGLDPAEAARRLVTTGPNLLPEAPPRPAWKALLTQAAGFLNVTLVAAALIAALVGDGKTAAVVAAVIVFNTTLGYLQEHRAERALAALKKMTASHARVRRGEAVLEVPGEEVVPGDVALLQVGDRVPADGRLLEARELEIDESSLTGESVPVAKRSDVVQPAATPLAERLGMAHRNGVVTRGRGEMLVTATGAGTEIGRIAGLIGSARPVPTPLQEQLDNLGKRLALLAACVIAAITVLELLRGHALAELAVEAVALGVSAVPEGLPAIVAVTLALGVQRMARQRAIVKRLASVETLGCTTVICSDKTGTLTRNEMTARALWLPDRGYAVSGAGYAAEGTIEPEEGEGPAPELVELATAIALCNDSRVDRGVLVGDPTEGALVTLALKAGLDVEAARTRLPRIAEVPFDSTRKLMATFHRDGAEVRLFLKGAPEAVLERCRAASGPLAARAADRNLLLAGRGLRVLAVAVAGIPADGFDPSGDAEATLAGASPRLVGLVGLLDPARPAVREALAECRRAGIAVKMMTGDQPVTAAAIARELGLPGGVVSGRELEAMDDAALGAALPGVAVFARLAPEQKLRLVEALRAQRHVVAMTGDGVNDAPALKAADIGVAMGSGTEVAKEAASMVLTDDDFATIVGAVREGRTIYGNILKFVRFQLATNMGALATVFAAPFLGLPSPLGPIQILWVNLIGDGPPALALSLDPPHPAVMSEPPRDPDERILSARAFLRLLFAGVAMAIGTLAVFRAALRDGGDPRYAATLGFTTFVLFQVANGFNARSGDRSAFGRHLFTNPSFWAAQAVVVGLQVAVVHWGPLRSLFGSSPLSLRDWALAASVAAGLVAVEEVRKTLRRAFDRWWRPA